MLAARALDALRVQAARQDEQALQKVVATHDELTTVRAVVGPCIRAFVEAGFGEDARPHDRANRCEFIVGSYYLLESLLVLAGRLDPQRV